MESVLKDKGEIPAESDLQNKLGINYIYWEQFESHPNNQLKGPSKIWNFASKKYR